MAPCSFPEFFWLGNSSQFITALSGGNAEAGVGILRHPARLRVSPVLQHRPLDSAVADDFGNVRISYTVPTKRQVATPPPLSQSLTRSGWQQMKVITHKGRMIIRLGS